MHQLGELLELAAILSRLSPALIDAPEPIAGPGLARYVAAWDDWTTATLARLTALPQDLKLAPQTARAALWQTAQADFAEVFAGNLLARVWGAVLTAADHRSEGALAASAAREVLTRHQQAHQQALQLLVHGPWLTVSRSVEIDRLRRRIERWCDVFVGHLAVEHGQTEFACDAARAWDFGEEQLDAGHGRRRELVWDMYLFCLRGAVLNQQLPTGSHTELRTAALRSILACLPDRLFLGDGTPAALALTRLLTAAEAAQPASRKGGESLNPRRAPSRSPSGCLPPRSISGRGPGRSN